MFRFLILTALILTCATQVTAKHRKVAKAGDWEIVCEGQTIDCSVSQYIKYDGMKVALIAGYPVVADGIAAALTIVLPRNVFLEPGITVKIDGKNELRYHYSACKRSICKVQMGLSQKQLDDYRQGRTGEISFFLKTAPETRRTLRFSLFGFSSAFTEVEKRSGPYSSANE